MVDEVLLDVGDDTREKIIFYCQMEANRSFSLTFEDHSREVERLKPQVLQGLSLESNPASSAVEVDIICNVYAYFHLASRRIIETVPMICEIAFAKGLGVKMQKNLMKMLGIIGKGGNKNSENFMLEDEGVRERRARLEKRRKTIAQSLEILDRARVHLSNLDFNEDEDEAV